MMSPSNWDRAVEWLAELADDSSRLPAEGRARPYFSQRRHQTAPPTIESLGEIARRAYQLIREQERAFLFSETLGYECVDGHGGTEATPQGELTDRVGKGHLWLGETESWTQDDLCDFLEVFNDLAASPSRGYLHDFGGCGWHPISYSRQLGQQLYRWRVNELLGQTNLDLRLAESGEDVGRMVQVLDQDLDVLISESLDTGSDKALDVAHAVALYRSRQGTREERRSAIVVLAGILEDRRSLIRSSLGTADESALFEIANRFDLRHRNARQQANYDDDFLHWIFHVYLATVHLTDRLLSRK